MTTSEAKIVLADGLVLDAAQAAMQRYAWIATSGGGKTYGEGRMVEQFHAANIPVLVVDTVGVWPSLRLAADGKSPGLPFVVIGGRHADVELDLGRGADLASFHVKTNASLVLDLSMESVKARGQFVTELCESLLLVLPLSRRPRMVVLDEAQDIAPEKARKWQVDMVAAVSALIRKARNHRCGVTLLTQRPQSVSKEVLNLASNVFLGMLHGKAERKAVQDWIDFNGVTDAVKEHLRELPSLEPGTFWFWSPAWLKRFDKVQILPKRTYDGSSTNPIDLDVELGEIAPVDLGELRMLLGGASVAPEGEPALMNAASHDALVALGEEQAARAELERERQELNDRLNWSFDRIERLEAELDTSRSGLAALVAALKELAETVVPEPQLAVLPPTPKPVANGSSTVGTIPLSSGSPPVLATAFASAAPRNLLPLSAGLRRRLGSSPIRALAKGKDGLEKGERAVLTVLSWQREPISKSRLALLAGYSKSGGGFGNILSALRTADRITGSGELSITQVGRRTIGPVPAPPVGPALFDWWCAHPRVDGGMQRVLTALRRARKPLGKTDLAVLSGYKSGTSGGFGNVLSRLRVLGLAEGKGKAKIQLVEDLRA